MKLPDWMHKYTPVREISEEYGVPESLRGWNTQLKQNFAYYLPTSVALVDCPSGRAAYLHISDKIRYRPTVWSARGTLFHELLHEAYLRVFDNPREATDEIIYRVSKNTGLDAHKIVGRERPDVALNRFVEFFKELKSQNLSVESEKELDGKPLCLSSLRADIFIEPPNTVLDLKTHKHRGKSLVYYQLQVTTYAMLIEAEQRLPVNIGGILEIVPEDSYRLRILPFFISPALRREVLRRIAQKIQVCGNINPEDPGPSPREHCVRCPFQYVCEQIE